MARLTRLTLANYRNFREADVALPPGVSVFHGENAQGKTALLEAAYTLAIGRSFRTEREREVINFDAGGRGAAAYVTGVACRDGQSITAVVGYQPTAQRADPPSSDTPNSDPSGSAGSPGPGTPAVRSVHKRIRVNRQPSTAAGLVGRIAATLFTVDDLVLVLGSPSHRRRYLDVLICQASRPYLDALQRYQAALRNRNGLLRRRREERVAPEQLEYWNDQLTQAGAIVAMGRAEALVRLAELAQRHHRELAEPDQTLAVAYRPGVPLQDTTANTAEAFRRRLRETAAREQATATTAVGPHRDDFMVFCAGRDANAFASRGEARTIALSLRLAEADYLAQTRADDPIILLDDVFSEMDAGRRRRVLQKVAGYRQTLITTTDAGPVRAVLGDAATYFRVSNGEVSREI